MACYLVSEATEQVTDRTLPGLSFIALSALEGAKVLAGRQTLQEAVVRAVERGIKTGTGMGVGWATSLIINDVVSLPANFITRICIERYRILGGLSRRLDTDIRTLKALQEEMSRQ